MPRSTRRTFLAHSLAATAAGAWGPVAAGILGSSGAATERIRTLRFHDTRGRRFGVPRGTGLFGRMQVDLSTLTPRTLITSNDRFYIRTRSPVDLLPSRGWTVAMPGLGRDALTMDELDANATPRGVHLMECSGNAAPFGLISAAAWSGVPLATVLRDAGVDDPSALIRVRGVDTHAREPRPGEFGARWIFTLRQLEETGAFLATRMNNAPLPPDHGRPVRLVVPGWYGCTCIKWVDEIARVPVNARATAHMREFAYRTHQPRSARLAREYRAADIDIAAMPVRVEQWSVDGTVEYRVAGVMWGGRQPTDALAIRFDDGASWTPVDRCDPRGTNTWSMWTHTWRPRRRGRYRIEMKVMDPSIRTRRLDRGFYARSVDVRST